MKIAVIGVGYVGLISALCLAKMGHSVIAIDCDSDKISLLQQSKPVIFEEGLAPLLTEMLQQGRIEFTTEIKQVEQAEVIIVAVGTPMSPVDGSADLSHVFESAMQIARYAAPYAVIVTKSTVPLGTGAALRRFYDKHASSKSLYVVSNPEFLREGKAIHDFFFPDRIVIGAEDSYAIAMMRKLYDFLLDKKIPLLETTIASAELIKYASNAFLAMKVTFINEIADICEVSDANVSEVARGMGLDSRIGEAFLQAGPGYGGSCFPKDTAALTHIANGLGIQNRLIDAVISANRARSDGLVQRIVKVLGEGEVVDKHIALLGVAFKANTDDVRYSPAIQLVRRLVSYPIASIRIFDPMAMENAQKELGFNTKIHWADSLEQAILGADLVVIITEWPEFKQANWSLLLKQMKKPTIIDFRNLLIDKLQQDDSYSYYGVGQKPYIRP
jgi:UDPglucose 6-dehydrogenase